MARPKPEARAAGPTEGQAYLVKAEEFLRAAEDSLALNNFTAAVGNAVHAGIAAADSISAIHTRTVWRGEHAQAPKHLEGAGEVGKLAARQLRRLLPLKSRAEYDPTPMRATEAKTAVQAAERMVAAAGAALVAAHPDIRGGSR